MKTVCHGIYICYVAKFMFGLYRCKLKTLEPSIDVCIFLKVRKSLELLPPPYDAVTLDVKRAAYKAMVLMKAAYADF